MRARTPGPGPRPILVALSLLAMATGSANSDEPPRLPPWRATWRAPAEPAPGSVMDPVELALGPAGSLLVVDRELRRVQRFEAEGEVTARYDPPAALGLRAPFGLAVDIARGRVYLSDSERALVHRFGLDGTYLPNPWGDLQQPEALAMGLEGRLHIYDRQRSGIVSRTPDGAPALDNIPVQVPQGFGSDLPNGLAVNAAGEIWFAAEPPVVTLPPILYVFDRDGDISPPRTRLDFSPRDLAFDEAGRGYLLDGRGSRLITDLDRASGAYLALDIGPGARAMAARGAGEVWLLEGPDSRREGGVRSLRLTGRRLEEAGAWRFPPLEAGWFREPKFLGAAGDGAFCLTDGTHRLQWLGADGRPLAQVRRPWAAAVAGLPDGDCLVARERSASSLDDAHDPDVAAEGTRRLSVERFRRAGTGAALVWSRDWSEPLDAEPPSSLAALAVDAGGGRVLALDASGKRLRAFDLATGAPGAVIPLPGGDGFAPWYDVDVDEEGRIWLLDFVAPRLVVLSGTGEMLLDVAAPDGALRLAALPTSRGGGAMVLTTGRELVDLGEDGVERGRAQLPDPAAGEARPPGDLSLLGEGVLVSGPSDRAIHAFGPAGGARARVFLPRVSGGEGEAAGADPGAGGGP